MKLFRLSDLVGNTVPVSLVRRGLESGSLPNIIILSGAMGSGKSTTAQIIGLSKTCENPQKGQACLKCESCEMNLRYLQTGGHSINIVKKNIALVTKEDEMRDLVNEIFVLLQDSLGQVVYILEEVHSFTDRYQTKLLEGFDRLGENTTVVMTTSHPSMLLPELKSRAITYPFSRISDGEAKLLIQRTAAKLGARQPSPSVERLLLKYGKGTPRDITKMVKFIKDSSPDEETLSRFMGFISFSEFIELFNSMKISMRDYMISLRNLVDTYTLDSVIGQFKMFMEEVLFYLESGIVEEFTKEEVEKISTLFGLEEAYKLTGQLLKLDTLKTSEEDFKLTMILMRKVLLKDKGGALSNNSRKAAAEKVESRENYRSETEFNNSMTSSADKPLSLGFLDKFKKED